MRGPSLAQSPNIAQRTSNNSFRQLESNPLAVRSKDFPNIYLDQSKLQQIKYKSSHCNIHRSHIQSQTQILSFYKMNLWALKAHIPTNTHRCHIQGQSQIPFYKLWWFEVVHFTTSEHSCFNSLKHFNHFFFYIFGFTIISQYTTLKHHNVVKTSLIFYWQAS